MQRLTTRNFDMCEDCPQGTTCEHYCDATAPVCQNKAIYDRLADYEDTGMEPGEMKRVFNENVILKLAAQLLGMTPEHIRKMEEAADRA